MPTVPGAPVSVHRMYAAKIDGVSNGLTEHVWVRIDAAGVVVDEIPDAVMLAAPDAIALLRRIIHHADDGGECPSCGGFDATVPEKEIRALVKRIDERSKGGTHG